MKNILLIGLQRSGTNFLETLIKDNITGFNFVNNVDHRSLPLHKHFRLYDEKIFIPESKYLNNFKYPNFHSFNTHVKQLLNKEEEEILYLVNTKEPYSWYISYNNLGKRMKWPTWDKKWLNAHYMIDYNLFYAKWLSFMEESDGKVMIVRYEDVLNDAASILQFLAQSWKLENKKEQIHLPDKVGMSKKFDKKRKSFYQSQSFMKELNSDQIMALSAHLDKDVISKLGYKLQ